MCEKCNRYNNCFYCFACNINLCEYCSKECENNFHESIGFQNLKDEIEYYKKGIKRIINENFIEPEKKETNGEKEQKSYEVIVEDKIIDDIFTETKIYSNDILSIRSILEKNYDNYFHFKNIKNCYLYLQNKYKNINEINILVKIEEKDINKKIYLLDNGYNEYNEYGYNKWVEHYNHDNLNELNKFNTELYINKRQYEYKKYFIPEKEGEYEIIIKFNIDLVDCSYMFVGCENIIDINFISLNTKNVTNMSHMFSWCESLNNLPDISKWDTKILLI